MLRIFTFSFLINFVWEVLHSQLYTTCLNAPLKKYIKLIVRASVSDAITITTLYMISKILFENTNILMNTNQLVFFLIVSLFLAYIWERSSLKKGRWEYSKKMPVMLKVGITPLLQLAFTGLLTFFYVFKMQTN